MNLPPAIVLTAGLGTRLRPLTYVRAKAAVPVNGETLARRAVRWLASQGVADLVLNLHHLPATVTGSVGDGADLGARVRYSWEQPVLGSAGGPRHALPLLRDLPNRESRTANREPPIPDREPRTANRDSFFIINGDTLTDIDVRAVLAAHQTSGAAVTMAVIPNPRPDKYGGVRVSDRGWVTGFTRAGSGGESYHFIGVQVADARVFAPLEDGVPSETVNSLYPRLIETDSRSIGAFVCDASFRDIGTPADYLDTSIQLAAREGNRMVSDRGTRIHDDASVVRSAVWDDVTIGRDAELTACVVGDGVAIPPGARYHRCAIVRKPDGAGAGEDDLLVRAFD
jgi:mannose-1-phosphate guanylyltransferase